MTNSNKVADALRIIAKVAGTAGLQYHEEQGLIYAAEILEQETETCKFNCRTAKENWCAGYRRALEQETKQDGNLALLAAVAYTERAK